MDNSLFSNRSFMDQHQNQDEAVSSVLTTPEEIYCLIGEQLNGSWFLGKFIWCKCSFTCSHLKSEHQV